MSHIYKRSGVKSQVTQFYNKLEAFEKYNKDNNVSSFSVEQVAELKERLPHFEALLDKYNVLQEQIELAEDDPTVDEEEREAFYTRYYALAVKVKLIIEKHDASKNINSCSNVSEVGSQALYNRVKLPAIKLPHFDGSPTKWLEFYDLFKALIHDNVDIKETEKFYYLRSQTSGEAAGAIHSIGTTADNYYIAWEALCERFNNRDLIIETHVKSLFEISSVHRESATALRALIDDASKHIRCLKNLNEPTDNWNTLIIYLISNKLDTTTRRLWETKRRDLERRPTFDDLSKFLQERWEILEKLNRDKQPQPNKQKVSIVNLATHTCVYGCKGIHPTYFACKTFKTLPIETRINDVRRYKLCSNCLRSNHVLEQCRMNIRCKTCNKKHNSLLHVNNAIQPIRQVIENEDTNASEQADSISNGTTCLYLNVNPGNVLLSTVVGFVKDQDGALVRCRILLDSGSQSNYISQSFCNKLNLKPTATDDIQVVGINHTTSNVGFMLNMTLFSLTKDYQIDLSVLVINRITSNLPSYSFGKFMLPIPQEINLADPTFNQSGPIDMLVGADIFWSILLTDRIELGKDMPILQNTTFGWIVGGGFSSQHNSQTQNSCLSTIDQIAKFWEFNDTESDKTAVSEEQALAENHFVNNTYRDENGRFVVKLPFKEDFQLGETRPTAERRFLALERRLQGNNTLKTLYSDFLTEYLKLGHMKEVTEFGSAADGYYMPHHGVLREHSLTTKLRVVFDASHKSSNGISLNDLQLVGPVVQSELLDILLRFRYHKYILSGDITKMYRQIMIDKSQHKYQRILWRENKTLPIRCFELNTVTYGMAAAPFLATRCIKQLSLESKANFPEESKIIAEDIYVDDLLTGAESKESLLRLKENISQILNNGRFELRKFHSNLPGQVEVSVDPYKNLTSSENKTLGVLWNSHTDKIQFNLDRAKPSKITKRYILSETARLFDPLGLLGPVIIRAKLLIQSMWAQKTSWDTPLDDTTQKTWLALQNELELLDKLKIPRRISNDNTRSLQIHGFADASEKAFGACLYLRSISTDNIVTINLITSKSRVAPLKCKATLPRLELAAALLLAQLTCRIKKAMPFIADVETTLWSDSTIALSWIASSSHRWKTFVSNRVSQIQTLTQNCNWRHVRSENNPADLVSRGMTVPAIATSNMWWHGPNFLKQTSDRWDNSFSVGSFVGLPELKTTTLLTTSTNNELFLKFSKFNKLLRVVAYIYRFYHNLKVARTQRKYNVLKVDEIEFARIKLLKLAQNESFNEEIAILRKNKQLTKSSKLIALSPFVDDHGLLRVGGRLRNADLEFSKRHQILLDYRHPLTSLIITQEHQNLMHCGPQKLLYSIRTEYWPINAKNLINKIQRKCAVCFKTNPLTNNPVMGDLPKNRVIPSPPFHICGVDFAGPILTKDKKTRGCKIVKSYICLFVCFATKAYHIEIASDLTTEAFLAAFKRFISRRGKPLEMQSDNGTNFVGADAKMKQIFNVVKAQNKDSCLNTYLVENGVTWRFTPPRSPHFGGLWEAGIKQIKLLMKRIIGNVQLTYEELETVTTQIEAVLNSRPLSPLSNDPNEYLPLTPSHFLIGRPLTALPDKDYSDVAENRLRRYQLTTKLVQHFWHRWQKEYLCNLQQRRKWSKISPEQLTVGDLVLLREDNIPPLQWRLARIIETYPGIDKTVRVVKVRLPNRSELKRATVKVCPLPKNDDERELHFSA